MTNHRQTAIGPKVVVTSPSQAYQDLVEQSEALAYAGPDEPLQISTLCRLLAVSDRTLRKAFHQIHGVPPCRHFRMLRLCHARSALLSADARFATVTEIATSSGFMELGRFSVEYREAFGESPSQTLQRPASTQSFRFLDCRRPSRGLSA